MTIVTKKTNNSNTQKFMLFYFCSRIRVYFFMYNLSIADFTTVFTTLIPEFFWTLEIYYGGNFTCKTLKFCQLFGPYLRWIKLTWTLFLDMALKVTVLYLLSYSTYILTMMTIDRYQVRILFQSWYNSVFWPR